MQLTLLQDDLFSAAGKNLPAPAPKKSKNKLVAVKKSTPEIEPAPHPVEAATLETQEISAIETPDAHVMESAPIASTEVADSIDEKAPGAFKTISEVADFLGLPQHVLRFWESRFSQIKPLKLRGGRRYYRPDDIEVLSTIQHLLYKQGYTINGAKKAFSQGKNALIEAMYAEKAEQTPAPKVIPRISDKQKSQLTSIRQELFALRETLRPFTMAEA